MEKMTSCCKSGQKLTSKTTVSIRTDKDKIDMPIFGLGTMMLEQSKAYDAVTWALKAGYRMIDTSKAYNNESEIGRAIKDSGLKREEVFIVTKVDLDHHGKERPIKALDESLQNLCTDYIDLYMIQQPAGAQLVATYKALVDLQSAGKIRAIGVAQFGVQHLEGLRESGLPTPAVNQIELNPYNRNDQIVSYCCQHDIAVMGFSPNVRGLKMDDPMLKEIAAGHKRSVPQVLIRWSLQRCYITIPRSDTKECIEENIKVFDFELTDSEMATLNSQQEDPKTRSMIPEDYPWQQVA